MQTFGSGFEWIGSLCNICSYFRTTPSPFLCRGNWIHDRQTVWDLSCRRSKFCSRYIQSRIYSRVFWLECLHSWLPLFEFRFISVLILLEWDSESAVQYCMDSACGTLDNGFEFCSSPTCVFLMVEGKHLYNLSTDALKQSLFFSKYRNFLPVFDEALATVMKLEWGSITVPPRWT